MSPFRRPDGVQDPAYVLGQIRTSLHWLVAATVVLYLGLAVLGVVLYRNSDHVARDEQQTRLEAQRVHDAICTLRSDLQQRVQTTRKFLHDHPEGVAGIPPAVLRQSMQGQQRTIKALSSLNCAGTDLPQG